MEEENNYIIRTIIRSPIVNFVFCGAFRNFDIYDIVLIKENSIELHSLSLNGLATCISDQPLFSKIRDAKVIKPTKKTPSEDDNIVNVDLLVTTNENGYLSFSVYGLNLKKYYYTRNFQNIMIQSLNIQDRFYIVEEIKIASYGYNLKNLGYKIALDPLMRFIATRNALNTVEILRLNLFNKNKSFIIERIKGNLFGTIVLMDFIKSLKNEKFCYLVFYIINYQKKSYITLCQWNSEESLISVNFSSLVSLPLFSDLSIPIYLVPFFNSTEDFSLIFNNKIIYISIWQFLEKNSDFKYFDIKHKGIITAYAIDENLYEEDITNIYLGTDAGDLIYVTVKNEKINYINLGSIKPIGRAMGIINSLNISKHLIFISGDMCDNGIYLVHPKIEIENIQNFPNWSPVCDFRILENTFLSNETQIRNKKDRLYLCSGRALEGKIAELKTGIKAKITLRVQDFNGIENFWILRNNGLSSIYIIISFPWQTQLLELTEKGELYDRSDDSQLEQETSTISAGLFNDMYIVQITQRGIKIFPFPDFKELNSKTHYLDDTQIVIFSSIHYFTIALLTKTKDSMLIYLMKLTIIEKSLINLIQIREPIEIIDEPSTMTIITIHDSNSKYYDSNISSNSNNAEPSILLLIGTHKPSFIIFELLSADKISVFDISLVGLRNGLLLRWAIDHINENIQLNFIDLNVFGSLPLKCVSNSQLSTTYIAGDRIWMINSYHDTMEIKEIILNCQIKTHIILMLPFDDPLQQSKITSVACISKEIFLIADLDIKESICVEYIDIKETPRRILYDKTSKLLILASNSSTLTMYNSPLNQKFQKSCDLKFINIINGTIVSNNPLIDSKTQEYVFDSQETIYALSDWTIFYENKSYHYIIIGTSVNNFSNVIKGNLHILMISYKFEKVEIEKINKISVNYPIYSISPIGKYEIAFSSGNTIFIKHFDIETKKFKELSTKYKLESPVISIKIDNNTIYALCQKDSITILNYDPIKNDATPRLSLDNFIIDNNIFCSDKERGLICLSRDCSQEKGSLYLNFSIKLPMPGKRCYYYPFVLGSGIDGSFYSIISCPKDDFEIYQALISYWLKFSNTNSLMDKEKFSIFGKNCLDGDFLETIVSHDWNNDIPLLSTPILNYLDDDSKKTYILKVIKFLRSIFSQSIF
ncbi:hypothetical protein PCANB_000998 [Pneumocystis canis]|nr:hypothetical protein PCANB_000998 [Pneumocystis canis]